MKNFTNILFIFVALQLITCWRPPSVPLVVTDPYVSIWSPSDNLYDSFPVHWANGVSALAGMVLVDGKCYRYMGAKDMSGSVCPNNMQQTNLEVKATQTHYTFQAAGVELNLRFITPALLTNIELLSLPLTYVQFQVSSVDGKNHNVQVYYDNSAEVAIDNGNEQVQWTLEKQGNAFVTKIGTKNQIFNEDNGSDRIDWGFWFIGVSTDGETNDSLQVTVNSDANARGSFAKGQNLPSLDNRQPRAASDNWPVQAVRFNLGTVKPNAPVTKHIHLTYDQLFGQKYFGTLLVPYWKHVHGDMNTLLSKFMNTQKRDELFNTCAQFDKLIESDLSSSMLDGLEFLSGTDKVKLLTSAQKYAAIGSLAYRQVTGGLTVVWNHIIGDSWVFMKEISSDGDVSTVDVIFPAAPLILYLSPSLFEKLNAPILEYANNGTAIYGQYSPYPYAFAPHHLGHWPVSYINPNEQENMPLEETADLFMLITFITAQKGSVQGYEKFWPLFKTWGDYLVANLPDPGDQLCTDDFTGPSPHNVNLAAKGIIGLGAYAKLLAQKGDTASAKYYNDFANSHTKFWHENGREDDLSHTKLQFNLKNTWSLKYNIFFQSLLDLEFFKQDLVQAELTFYLTKQFNKYGIPLDNRATFAKVDWEFWMLAVGSNQQFASLVDKIYDFVNDTPQRVPFTDWYETTNARQSGFQARPVLGGIWSKVVLHKHQQKKLQQQNIIEETQ